MSIDAELKTLEECLRETTRAFDGAMARATHIATLVLAEQPDGAEFLVPGLGALHQEMTRRTDEILDAIADLRKKRGS